VRDERPDDVGVSVAYPLPGTLFHERVKEQLGARTNWSDSDDLAMMFRGTYEGVFYKRVRDLLHEEVAAFSGAGNAAAEAETLFDARWLEMEDTEASFRTERTPSALSPVFAGV
jgi:anaerobic magnesium-protoporphyrin IX monomethyl ester cyclase